ncbi:MAG: hypothetical protein L6R42_000593, partial [Xanthoria sp. 1 TBL-2021]
MPSAAKVVTIAPPALPAVQIKTRAQKKALLAVPMVSRAQRVLNAAKTTMALIAPPSAYQHLSFPTWRDEGGAGSVITCVPKELNDWQGTYFGSWLAEAKSRGFKSGDQFRVRLKFFDFNFVQRRELLKRSSPILSDGNNVTIISSSAFDNHSNGNNAVIIPLTPDPEYGYMG